MERILSKKGDYYKILAVEKSSLDTEIKKAYRKLALKIHPDKNSHPSAPEAFKVAAKAFEILSDSNKKSIYDQTGQDPDLRAGGFSRAGGGGGGAGFPAGFGNGGQQFHFGQEGFNDDIFNMFFGGMSGQSSGFSFGPGVQGFQFQSFDGTTRRRRAPRGPTAGQARGAGTANDGSFRDNLATILPILLVLFISFISNMFSSTEQPAFSFKKQGEYKYERATSNYNVNYYVTKEKFEQLSIKDLRSLDNKVERKHVENLHHRCQLEQNTREQIFNEAQGFFYTDEAMVEQARNYPTPNCNKLRTYGLL